MLSTTAGVFMASLAQDATSLREQTAMAIDCHAHVFLRNLPMPDQRRAPSGYDAQPEAYLRILEANGMTQGVLVQPSFLGTDNSYLLDALRRYPEKFRGIAVVPPTIGSVALDELQNAGVVGIRLNLVGLPTPAFSSAVWTAFLNELRQRNMQVEIHQHARLLESVLEPLLAAGLNVVVDHLGRPDPRLGIDDPGFRYLLATGASRRVWVKLSGAYRNGADGRGSQITLEALPLLRKSIGLDRLMWGSDWPHTLFESSIEYSEQHQLLEQWMPKPEERRVVLTEVPASLFGFPLKLAE